MNKQIVEIPTQQNPTHEKPETSEPIVSFLGKTYVWISLLLLAILLITSFSYLAYQNYVMNKKVLVTKNSIISEKILRVGENIDEDGLQADTKEFQPFINYLVNKLKNQGIDKGEFVGTKSVTEMTELVREGKLDVVIDSAFPVYVVNHLTSAEPIADRWKGAVDTYRTVVFVKKDSPIQTISDLKGKMLAFDSLTPTAGYFLPKAELTKQGYTLTQKDKTTDPVGPNEIGYSLVHGNVYEAVANGVTPAGAESELAVDNYFGDKMSNYRIIFATPYILRFLVATRNDLNPNTRDAIKSILFSMDQNPEGKSVLAAFANTAKFTPVTTTDTAYGEIKNLANFVEQELITQ
jgi:phosphonate transport system substrate-binding protein